VEVEGFMVASAVPPTDEMTLSDSSAPLRIEAAWVAPVLLTRF
jgi:hypothetical protein